jgi:hypothetical protein
MAYGEDPNAYTAQNMLQKAVNQAGQSLNAQSRTAGQVLHFESAIERNGEMIKNLHIHLDRLYSLRNRLLGAPQADPSSKKEMCAPNPESVVDRLLDQHIRMRRLLAEMDEVIGALGGL